MPNSYSKPRPLKVDIYEGEIVAADTMPFHWRVSSNNPEGMTVRFVVNLVAEDGAATVTDAIDVANIQRLASVFASVGLKQPNSTEEILQTVHRLKGMKCLFAIKNIIPEKGKHAGKEKAVVSRWIYDK